MLLLCVLAMLHLVDILHILLKGFGLTVYNGTVGAHKLTLQQPSSRAEVTELAVLPPVPCGLASGPLGAET